MSMRCRYVPMFGEVEFDSTRAYSSVPLEEQIDALETLVGAGKILSWGLSNETAWGLARFCDLSRTRGCSRPAALSNAYNLLCRTADVTVAEGCYEEGVHFLAYSPVAMGLLSGQYTLKNGQWAGHAERRLVRYKNRYAEAESRCGLDQALLLCSGVVDTTNRWILFAMQAQCVHLDLLCLRVQVWAKTQCGRCLRLLPGHCERERSELGAAQLALGSSTAIDICCCDWLSRSNTTSGAVGVRAAACTGP
jgi:Aldo/keto reductase family